MTARRTARSVVQTRICHEMPDHYGEGKLRALNHATLGQNLLGYRDRPIVIRLGKIAHREFRFPRGFRIGDGLPLVDSHLRFLRE